MCKSSNESIIPDNQLCSEEMDNIFKKVEEQKDYDHLMHSDDPEDTQEVYKKGIDDAIKANNR